MNKTALIALAGLAALAFGGQVVRADREVQKGQLPFVVYNEADGPMPYIPSGYMGNTGAIQMDGKCTDNPHSGKTCLKVQYKATDGWGGVVWQSPVNDWGEKDGGYKLTGATKLTFWARGENGGEVVSYMYGLIKSDKPFHDSSSGKLDKIALTKDWKEYTIDLTGNDMSCIKTGFTWVLGASGSPVTFYLDDIEYDK